MESKLVRFDEDILVEAAAKPGEAKPAAAVDAETIHKSYTSVQTALEKICRPFRDTFAALCSTAGAVEFTKAEVELSLAFTAEGNLFVAKAKGEAGLKIKLTLEKSHGPKEKPKIDQLDVG